MIIYNQKCCKINAFSWPLEKLKLQLKKKFLIDFHVKTFGTYFLTLPHLEVFSKLYAGWQCTDRVWNLNVNPNPSPSPLVQMNHWCTTYILLTLSSVIGMAVFLSPPTILEQNATNHQWRIWGGMRGACPPRPPNSFDFIQFSGKFSKIVCWRPPGSWRPPGEILDPPLPTKITFTRAS